MALHSIIDATAAIQPKAQPQGATPSTADGAPRTEASPEAQMPQQHGLQSTFAQAAPAQGGAGRGTVGIATILPSEQGHAASSAVLQNDEGSLAAIVAAFHRAGDGPAPSVATQHGTDAIVANIGDSAPMPPKSQAAGLPQTPRPAAQQISTGIRQAADTPTPPREPAPPKAGDRQNLPPGPGRAALLSSPYAESMEALYTQAMIVQTQSILAELQALVEVYAAPYTNPDAPVPLQGRPLDANTLALLLRQAKDTALGQVHPTSAVVVLDTEPQTLIAYSAASQRYSVFNMAGESVGQIDHADVDRFAIDLGEGRVGALGLGGFVTNLHLPGPNPRTVISALHPPSAAAPSATSRAKLGQKVTRVAQAGGPDNSASECASACFYTSRAKADAKVDPTAGRCVLCPQKSQ